MEKMMQKFFLGANSCTGFTSYFEDSFKADDYKAYLIKGGPGTGKSSLMKYITACGIQHGENPILCPCSSDPYSLDGVIFENRKTVILDATAPHVVEPKLPGAKEEIINLGDFWDSTELYNKRHKIAEATAKNRLLHKTCSGYLLGCGQLLNSMLSTAENTADTEKVISCAKSYAKKFIPDLHKKGSETTRFLQGITPLGIVSYADTIKNFYLERIVISDPYGAVSNTFMKTIREYALKNGADIITVRNTFLPERLIDHILIPSLSLAFVCENSTFKLNSDDRRIHARRFMNVTATNELKKRIRFKKKISRELLIAACETLALAKASHDELEKLYIEAMDFEALSLYSKQLAQKIFG